MIRAMMTIALAASIWMLCTATPGRAVDPCMKCECKVVKAWSNQSTGEPVFGLRMTDPNNAKNTVAVDHSPTSIGIVQIRSSKCDDVITTKTGNSYTKYQYNKGGTAACTGMAGQVEMTVTDPDDFASTQTAIDQTKCDKAGVN